MEQRSKAQTFIGFAIRTGRYRIGLNSIESLKKAYLVIACKSASENSVIKAQKFAEKMHCPLFITKEKLLEEFTSRANSKVMAIADKDLATAIIDNSENDFIAKN